MDFSIINKYSTVHHNLCHPERKEQGLAATAAKDLYDGTAEASVKQHKDPSFRRRRALLLIQDDKIGKRNSEGNTITEPVIQLSR